MWCLGGIPNTQSLYGIIFIIQKKSKKFHKKKHTHKKMDSVLIPIIIAVGSFLLYLALDSKNVLFGSAFLFIIFWFASANLDARQGFFYIIGIIFFAIFGRNTNIGLNEGSARVGEKSFGSTFLASVVMVGVGIAIYGIMRVVSGASPVGASIIGVPTLSILDSQLTSLFSITIIALLGVIENRAFFTLYHVIVKSPLGSLFGLIPFVGGLFSKIADNILAIIITSVTFAFFHISVYGLNAGALVFASIIMGTWIISWLLTNRTYPADTSHALWNGIIEIGRRGISFI